MDVLEPEVLTSCVDKALRTGQRIFSIRLGSGMQCGIASELSYHRDGLTQVRIGRLLGRLDYSAVSELGWALKKRTEDDRGVREQYAREQDQVRQTLSNVEI